LDEFWSFFLFILAFFELPITKKFAYLSTYDYYEVYVDTRLWAVEHTKANVLNSKIHTCHPLGAALIPRREMINPVLISFFLLQWLLTLFWWIMILLSLSLSFLGLTYKKKEKPSEVKRNWT